MRLWHKDLLHYLPDNQFRGQLRELIAIMRDWRETGSTHHLLINRAMEYPKADLLQYFRAYALEYQARYRRTLAKNLDEFQAFAGDEEGNAIPFHDWHDKDYLRICMANLCEKHLHGRGRSRITDGEWAWLLEGYREITGEEYRL